jgi:MYXO-CTERM domain-containing protein
MGSITSASGVYFGPPVFGAGTFVTLASNGNLLYYSDDDGATWHAAAFSPSLPHPLSDIAWNGSMFVGLGTSAGCGSACMMVYTSSDGIHWTQQPYTGGSAGVQSPIATVGSTFYVVSNDITGSAVFTSTDGIHWATTGAAVTGPSPYVGASGHSLIPAGSGSGFVTVMSNPLAISTSKDFASWSQSSNLISGEAGAQERVIYANKQFLSVGDDILSSGDGTQWALGQIDSPVPQLSDVAWNGSVYAVVGSQDYWSSDLIHWQVAATPPPASDTIAAGNGLFVAVGSSGLSTSPDGSNWTTVLTPPPNLVGIAWTGNKFVTMSSTFVVPASAVRVSSDGITWGGTPSFTLAGGGALPGGATLGFERLRWTGTELVAAGEMSSASTPILATSPDGVNWTIHSFSSTSVGFSVAKDMEDVVSLDGVLYATNGDGLITSTDDAASWTENSTFPISGAVNSVTTDGTHLIAAGLHGDVIYGTVTHPPTADAGKLTVTAGSSAKGTLVGKPGISGNALLYAFDTQPTHGSFELTDSSKGSYTYTPDASFTGTDKFTFTVTDVASGLVSTPATITATVTAKPSSSSGSGGGGGNFGLLMILGLAGLAARRRRT